jgi:hypothetical protein
MSAPQVFGKLNLKDQKTIVVLKAPASFEQELARLRGVDVRRTLSGSGPIGFALAFVTRQEDVDTLARSLTKRADGDALLWFAYPKGTSKRYTCDFNRDTGWAALGQAGFECVRAVAIDEDWSALRFRRAEFIKTMTRSASGVMSATGRAKVGRVRKK